MRFNDGPAADRIAELFDENAIFQVVGRLRRRPGGDSRVLRWRRRATPAVDEPGELLKQPPSVHLSANPVIDIDGHTATSELDFLVVGRGEDGRARSTLVGRYRDRLRRLDDGRWVITSRVGVSVARPGDAQTDNEWQQVLARLPEDDRARFLT